MCAKATTPDTTLVVGQAYEGGYIESISIDDHFAVVYKNGSLFTLPLAENVVINDYYKITTIVVSDGKVVLATGTTPMWVVVLVIILVVAAIVVTIIFIIL
jgi:hypothetical protein